MQKKQKFNAQQCRFASYLSEQFVSGTNNTVTIERIHGELMSL